MPRVLSTTLLFAVVMAQIVGATEPDEGTPLDHDLSRAELANGRDLSQYEDGGDFVEERMELTDVIALRTFIWQHWKQKRRGYVRFKFCGTDHCVTCHIFIEPSGKREWHIQKRTINRWQAAGPDFVTRTLFDREIISVDAKSQDGSNYAGKTPLILHGKDGENEIL